MKEIILKVLDMNKQERLLRLCQLSAREQLGVMNTDEIIEMSAIQAIRMTNGEIDEIIKKRADEAKRERR